MNDELTPRMLAQSRVIAKGNRIRDVQRLVDRYGGNIAKWVKKVVLALSMQAKSMSTTGMNTWISDVLK